MPRATITSLGNAGIQVDHGGMTILIDPFFGMPGETGVSRWECARRIGKIDLILITHEHWDHFNAADVENAVGRTGATVVGPAVVIRRLKGQLPPDALIELEPPVAGHGQPYRSLTATAAGANITAFRTAHAKGHNSYLVVLPGLRFFHDGDNERTQDFDRAPLMRLDALMLCPWQGAGWVEFIEAIRPANWFLIHMDGEELGRHAEGKFFPELCDRLPMDPIALRPGESRAIE